MATVRKRGEKFCVIYSYKTREGGGKQKWETFATEAQAQKRKLQVELDEMNGTLFVASDMLFEKYIREEFIPTYAKTAWKHSTYDTNLAIFQNHIFPHFGKMKLSEIRPYDVDKFLSGLSEKKVLSYPNVAEQDKNSLSFTTIRYIYILLRKSFSKAVEWEKIAKTPAITKPPEPSTEERTIWEPDQVLMALGELEKDKLLHLAVHLSFRATLRAGETVGLTFDCIDFENRTITINKELARVSKEALSILPKKDIIHVFPETVEGSKSLLVLKKPKTSKSIRTNRISVELRDELLERKKQVVRDKVYAGEAYHDNDLVFCFEDGRPIEAKRCSKWFKNWQKKSDFGAEKIVFHQLRHSSTSFKLAISDGDIKAVQGDSGHTTLAMVADVYGHALKSKKEALANKFDSEFYGETKPSKPSANDKLLSSVVLEQIQKDPAFLESILLALNASNAQVLPD